MSAIRNCRLSRSCNNVLNNCNSKLPLGILFIIIVILSIKLLFVKVMKPFKLHCHRHFRAVGQFKIQLAAYLIVSKSSNLPLNHCISIIWYVNILNLVFIYLIL